MPRIKVKKGPRVFHGKKFWEVSDIGQEHASSSRDMQGQLGHDRPIDTTPTTRQMSASKQTTMKNMSAEKLQNSDFKKLFQSRMLTSLEVKAFERSCQWIYNTRLLYFE